MEQAVTAHYGHAVWLPDDFRNEVRNAVDAAVTTNHSLADDMRDQYTRRLTKLDAKESYFLDLAAEEGWPKDTLRSKIAVIRQEHKQLTRELDQAEQRLDTGRAIFHRALELLDDPQALYQRGNETVKTILNQAFFTRLYVDGHKVGEHKVGEHELREPFDVLNEAYRLYRDHRQAGRSYHRRSGVPTHRAAVPSRYGGSDLETP